ncbi:hypothetical protein ABVK25_007810 [Lepraria finkii]|uniref:Uncharacterized protein n=1 Tax=Lepraria finkii TaxID=1340010 RepID=A0ABR4B2C5_9LECA
MQLSSSTLLILLLHITKLVLAAPPEQKSSVITQPLPLLPPNHITNVSTTALPTSNPVYEEYPIPNTSLTLHLTLRLPLNRIAMEACLLSASVWVGAQFPQSASIPKRDFEWKDHTGAMFNINSLSKRLTWEDVGNVLRGLKMDLYDQGRYFTAAFTVEERTTGMIIGAGSLEGYVPPKPPVSSGEVETM